MKVCAVQCSLVVGKGKQQRLEIVRHRRSTVVNVSTAASWAGIHVRLD